MQKHIVFLILPNVQLLDLAGPLQVFDTAKRLLGAEYKITFCSAEHEVRSTQLLYLAHLEPLPELDETCRVLIPGTGVTPRANKPFVDQHTKNWLQEGYRAGAQMASICSGTAVLGESGLLHRRRCTTHWEMVEDLQACYPSAQVVDGVLYVHDRGITTSAGVTSGIDMALWMLEQDYGPRVSAEVARQLVVYLRRNGLEQQVSVYLEYRSHQDMTIHRVQDWLAEHISEPASLRDLAKVGLTSERTLARSFKAATGITPHKYHQLLRLELAAQMVYQSNLPFDTIARKSGFGDTRQFRRSWREHYGSPPSSSRQFASKP